MVADRLFDVARKTRWSGSRALVPLDPERCPSCGAGLDLDVVAQGALFFHGGYGAAELTVTRHCRCGWRLEAERSETRPY